MNKNVFLFAFLALSAFVSAEQNYENSLAHYFSNLAGNQTCNSIFYNGNLCGFFVLGLTIIIIWVMYAAAIHMPSDGIILSTSLWLIVLSDTVVGWIPYGVTIALVLAIGIGLYKAWEATVTT